jgi:hypothetical protein
MLKVAKMPKPAPFSFESPDNLGYIGGKYSDALYLKNNGSYNSAVKKLSKRGYLR